MKKEHLERVQEVCKKHNVKKVIMTSDEPNPHIFLLKHKSFALNHARVNNLKAHTVSINGDVVETKAEKAKAVKEKASARTKASMNKVQGARNPKVKTLSEMNKTELIAQLELRKLDPEKYSSNPKRAKACRDWDKKNGGAPKPAAPKKEEPAKETPTEETPTEETPTEETPTEETPTEETPTE